MISDARNEGKIVYQKDLAEVMGVNKQAFSNKLKRKSFSIHDLICIAEYFDMKVIVIGNGKKYLIEKED